MILDNCQCGSTLFLDLSHHKGNPIKSSQNKHNFQQNCIAPWSTLGPPCFTLPGTPCTGCGYMDLLSAIAASSCTVESSGCAFASGRNWHGNTYQAHGDGLGWVGWAGWAGMKVQLGLALEENNSELFEGHQKVFSCFPSCTFSGSWAEVREIPRASQK